MKKVIFVILILIYSGSQALSPYEARYALNATTDLGSLKVGTADFKLELNGNNEFTFSSQSYTDSIWKKLYNYTRYEKSIGSLEGNIIRGRLYDIVEIEKDGVTKNNKISHYQKNKKYSFSRGSFFEVKSKKSTNNYGYFSSKDYLINKNLVAVIGDSYVVASEVDNDETFHSLLDKEINQDVYAFGVNSDQLSQYLFNTQWVTKKFKPNIIIYSIVLCFL